MLGNGVKTFHPRNFGDVTTPENSEKWGEEPSEVFIFVFYEESANLPITDEKIVERA
jgi:hypothetical protein